MAGSPSKNCSIPLCGRVFLTSRVLGIGDFSSIGKVTCRKQMFNLAPNFKVNGDLNSGYHSGGLLFSFWLQKKKVWEGCDVMLFLAE
jgi:hypothetical protein